MLGRYAWIDLETTGLSVENCDICEIACIITDPLTLKEIAVFTRVIDSRTAYWEHFALEMHRNTGLYDQMGKTGTSKIEEVVVDFIKFLEQWAIKDEHGNLVPYIMAGSAIWFDRQFIKEMITESVLRKFFSHRMVDVSSTKIEIRVLCGEEVANEFNNLPDRLMETQHRALDDIRHSIGQLKSFRDKGLIGGQDRDR